MSLLPHLHALESSGLIRLAVVHPELEYLFRHALVQDAAYASLVKADRQSLHQTVGEALERLYPDRLASQELAPLLGQHFAEGGDDARALKYFTLAGDAAARVYANAEASMHYTRALEIAVAAANRDAPLQHLYLQRGRALELSGRYEEALRNYQEMEALARQRSDRPLELAALLARATVHSVPTDKFDAEQGQALSQQALALARELGDRAAEAKSLWNLLLVSRAFVDLPNMLKYGEQAEALARELGLREQLAFILNDIQGSYLSLGQPARALAALEEARELWRELNNKPMLADSLSSLSLIYFLRGDYDQALSLGEEAYRLSQSIDNLWGQSYSLWNLGFIFEERGELDEAIRALNEALRLGEQAGFGFAEGGILSQLATLYGYWGAVERGLELAQLALAKAEAFPRWRTFPFAALVILNTQSGHLAAAEAAMQEASQLLGDLVADTLLGIADCELGLAQHDYARVAARAEAMSAVIRQVGLRTYLSVFLYFKGQALYGQGQLDQAVATLREALAEAEAIGSRRSLWLILVALSQLEAQRGNSGVAQTLRAQAREIIEYIASHCPPDLRPSLLSLPDVRALNAAEQPAIPNPQGEGHERHRISS